MNTSACATKEEATRTGWRVVLCRIALPRKWRSRLNGNGQWFVRQSSFSEFARRSFSRQLRGEKEIGEKGHLLFATLPTRFCFLSALLYLLYLRFSLFLPLYSRFLILLSSPCPFRGYSTYGRTQRTPPLPHAKKVFEIRFPR